VAVSSGLSASVATSAAAKGVNFLLAIRFLLSFLPALSALAFITNELNPYPLIGVDAALYFTTAFSTEKNYIG
jgi:hypothetical protein